MKIKVFYILSNSIKKVNLNFFKKEEKKYFECAYKRLEIEVLQDLTLKTSSLSK